MIPATAWPCPGPAIVLIQRTPTRAAALICDGKRWQVVFGPVKHRP